MYIIVINAGSSSVKFTCYGPTVDSVMAAGMVERIGLNGTLLHYRAGDREPIEEPININDTAEAVAALARYLIDPHAGCLSSLEEIQAVGHRVVHGGEKLNQPMVIDAAVKEVIREYFDLAPLHNPPNLEGIEAAETAFPRAVHVGDIRYRLSQYHSRPRFHVCPAAGAVPGKQNPALRISRHQPPKCLPCSRPVPGPYPGRAELDHLSSRQWMQHNGGTRRPQSGHQHGPNAVGGIGHGHPLRRSGPGHRVATDGT